MPHVNDAHDWSIPKVKIVLSIGKNLACPDYLLI